MRATLAFLLAAACALPAGAQPGAASAAELATALASLRAAGCSGQPGNKAPLREQPALTRAARTIAGGEPLEDALRSASYKASQSMAIALQGPQQPRAIAEFALQRYCRQLLRPELTELGSHRSGNRTWIVLAAPFTPPAADDAIDVARTVLQLVNQARAQPRRCGSQAMAAVPAVALSDTLSAAALGHSRDMARNGYFDHTGRDGSKPADRATRAGYRWRMVGENIAAGQATPQEAVAGWLRSPGHCVNLMRPEFSEMGLAFAVNRASEQGIYWTQLFGQPR